MRAASRQVLARYSARKVGAWVVVVAAVSVWTLVEAASAGWRLPQGRYAWLFPEAVVGAALGLLASAALLARIALAQGAAIAAVDDELVLYFPFRRRRIGLQPGVSVEATTRVLEVPQYGRLFRAPPVVVSQVTVRRPGSADVIFRTALLSESAEVIANRIQSRLN
jgi:hypothetical protein